jgi:hypothetical protein
MLHVGVGQYPYSFPVVWGSGIVSSQHSPSRIKPHLGQVSEYNAKPPGNKQWGIFHKHVPRSNVANDSRHLRPEAGSLACDPRAFSGG